MPSDPRSTERLLSLLMANLPGFARAARLPSRPFRAIPAVNPSPVYPLDCEHLSPLGEARSGIGCSAHITILRTESKHLVARPRQAPVRHELFSSHSSGTGLLLP